MNIDIPGVQKASSLVFYPGTGASHTPGPAELPEEPLSVEICYQLLNNLTVIPRFQTPEEICADERLWIQSSESLYDLVNHKIVHKEDRRNVFTLRVDTSQMPELYEFINRYAVKSVNFPESMAATLYLDVKLYDHRPAQLWFRYQAILGGRRLAEVDSNWLDCLTDKIATVFN